MSRKNCGFYIINDKGEILICHQSRSHWSIPKGRKDRDECKLEAAIRETLEETNIELPKLEYHKLPVVKYKNRNKKLFTYLAHQKQLDIDLDKADIKCESFEIDNFKWVDIKTAKSILKKSQRKNLKKIKKTINSNE